ncbi:MAG: hypothetical protein ACI3Z5_06150 [Paludibacteraceae bacterium]
MKKIVLFIAVVGMLGLSSCSSTYKSTVATATTLDLQYEPLMVDLEVGKERISETIRIENTKRSHADVNNMLETAIYETLRKVNADALIGMQYTKTVEYNTNKQANGTEKTNSSVYVVTVSGYPVYYKNFRPVPKEKIEFDVRELKAETPYIILEKDQDGNQKGYRVITTTKVKNQAVLPLNDTDLEKLVLGKPEGKRSDKPEVKKSGKSEKK